VEAKVGVLSGYRILDLSDEKGMFATRLLADMGAEVIRIEKPGAPSRGDALDYDYLNAGKKSISLGYSTGRGREIFQRLVEAADVLVETEPPGYLESLGLGYDVLRGINPALVMAAVTPFGQDGPYRDYRADDLVLQALGGWLSVTGEPDRPLKLAGNQAYYTASLFAVNGILLALWSRHTTGRGQFIDISMMECVAATLDHALVRYFSEGIIAGRQGNWHWHNAFRIFPGRDGYVLLSLLQHWETLVAWLDSEGMAEDLTDAKWLDREERLRGIDHIGDVLRRWTLAHRTAELEETGQLMHFPWARVFTLPQLLANPQLKERDYFTQIEVKDSGKQYRAPGAPVRMSASPWRAGGKAPSAGEHSHEILRETLGLSEEAMGLLSREGII
jgi:crotonobetainyl-CoA:carnitine CoA-transferase CaiB-like acyl-CoA transferase